MAHAPVVTSSTRPRYLCNRPGCLRTVRRATTAAAVGNVAEWYDFGIYSYLAAVVLDRVFFPEVGEWAAVYTLGAFAAAFVMRPLGGLIFGRLGDRYGRTK